jgi:hypothetical protein
MAVTGVSNVADTIEKVVSMLTTKTLIQNSVALAMPGVWDRSGEVRPGMDRLDMIELAALSIQTVDETGAAMTPQTITPSARQLSLNQHKSVPFSVTKRGELQSKIALVQKTIENGVRSLAADIDNYVFSVAVAAAGTTQTVAAADALEAIRGAAKAFDLANVPKEGRALVCSPGFLYDDLLANNNVIRANEFGSVEPIRMAAIASIYGILIFESSSSNIADDGFLAIGMESMAFARQRALSFESQEQVLNQKTDYALTHLYGAQSTAASNPRIYVYNPA